MIPKTCKRLAEVEFPIAEVSRHAAREKSIRHGHPSTLHLWWARRPLASSRAILMALLLPDPCDEDCPPDFKDQARKILGEIRQPPKDDVALQKALLSFIGTFANWDLSSDPTCLRVARNLVRAAHPEEPPLVVDPFAGGGSIPLEALRIGCEAFATDLNPVACLILKVMLEDIPRHGPKLAEELRRVGGEIKTAAAETLADLYPTDPDGATPIAYLWARTVRCESPKCGAEIPLLRSLWLCKKPKRKRALRTAVVRAEGAAPQVDFEIIEPETDREVADGSVSRARATCLCCGSVLPPDRVRTQLAARKGGADAIFDAAGNRVGGARMTAVVTLRPGETGRHYRLPTKADYAAVRRARERVEDILAEWDRGGRQGLCPVPDEPISQNELRRISVPLYGMKSWGDLFTARQKVALVTLGKLTASADAANQSLALAFTRAVNAGCSLCRWDITRESHQAVYSRQALPLVWDYSEGNPLSQSTGGYEGALDWVTKVIDAWPESNTGQVQSADAADHPLPDQSAGVWFTDPPYYDAVPYAHLADLFFVWLRRTLPDNPLFQTRGGTEGTETPKEREIVVDRPHRLSKSHKDNAFYEAGMAKAFAEGRRILRDDSVGSVVFAHKTTEGWEALLSGMIKSGLNITGSWPIATEMGSRLNARETASLATSVHLICRPRPDDAPVGDWADVLRELPRRVVAWIERLQDEGIRGADLVFACIGPALEVFSRYRSVETAEGRVVGLPEYLEKVWEVVGRAALERVLGGGEASSGVLEADARLTALFLWALQSTDPPDETGKPDGEDEEAVARVAAKGFSLPFDVVRRFAQPMGIDLNDWTGRTIAQSKGVVRLLPVADRARRLFGEKGARAAADWIESDPAGNVQRALFPEMDGAPKPKGRSGGKKGTLGADAKLQTPDATTLDRVHAAMLLQKSGQTNALRALMGAERERGPAFLRLANALSALYPRGAEEKRLLDAMLLAMPR